MPRKKSNIHYIYKTTCTVTGKYYVGMHSTNNLNDDYIGSGKRLRYSIRKHGKENHVKEILEFFETREQLIECEKALISSDMLCDDQCMNLMSGGTGGFISVEQQRYRSICGGKAHSLKLQVDEEYRKLNSERSSSRMIKLNELGKMLHSTRFTDKRHSDETKKLISEQMKFVSSGERNSQFGTCWITKDSVNKKIKISDLHNFEIEGWVKGRKY